MSQLKSRVGFEFGRRHSRSLSRFQAQPEESLVEHNNFNRAHFVKSTPAACTTMPVLNDQRPNPDELLARVRDEQAKAGRGRLRIFLGMPPRVGKTYAMLEAARREKAEGADVVVGYVEPHGRQDTERLLEGLEAIPHRLFPYQGVTVRSSIWMLLCTVRRVCC